MAEPRACGLGDPNQSPVTWGSPLLGRGSLGKGQHLPQRAPRAKGPHAASTDQMSSQGNTWSKEAAMWTWQCPGKAGVSPGHAEGFPSDALMLGEAWCALSPCLSLLCSHVPSSTVKLAQNLSRERQQLAPQMLGGHFCLWGPSICFVPLFIIYLFLNTRVVHLQGECLGTK